MGTKIEVKEDNSALILGLLELQIKVALEACGQQAVSHAKSNITAAGRVDTGAMRNSMTHQVQEHTCYVGTNNEYAPYHEYGTGIYADNGEGRKDGWHYVDAKGNGHWTRGIKPIHFLKNAIANNQDEYRAIIKRYLQSK